MENDGIYHVVQLLLLNQGRSVKCQSNFTTIICSINLTFCFGQYILNIWTFSLFSIPPSPLLPPTIAQSFSSSFSSSSSSLPPPPLRSTRKRLPSSGSVHPLDRISMQTPDTIAKIQSPVRTMAQLGDTTTPIQKPYREIYIYTVRDGGERAGGGREKGGGLREGIKGG